MKTNKKNRVVITGLGVIAPNANNLNDFSKAIQQGKSGISFHEHLKEKGFSCCIGGIPELSEEKINSYLTPLQQRGFNSTSILYGCIAAIDAWKDAGFTIDENGNTDFDTGIIFGTGISGIEKLRESILKIDEHKVRRLGSTSVVQTMASGIAAYLGGIFGTGNITTTNSSACTTGTEAILLGFERIQAGKAKRMIVGSCSDSSLYSWGGFDAMRVMTYKHNDTPEKGSRPMSATASGFVPGSGAACLILEDLESAIERNATIYGEVLGGNVNSGGQRNGGTLTAPNATAVQKCIIDAVENAGISTFEIDAINGHLTATSKDALEVENWTKALSLSGKEFPYINSLKSHVGHCLAASGAIESVATVLQLKEQFVFPNMNCEDIHPEILELIASDKIPHEKIETELNIIAKASFGFGDVNACVIFKKYN